LNQFTIYSTNYGLAGTGPYPYTLTCDLANFSGFGTASATADVYLVDPCDSPFSLQITGTTPGITTDYDDSQVTPVTWEFPTYTVDPVVCVPNAFECKYVSGPYVGNFDMCDFSSTNGGLFT
jgi:hypothetical protein